MEMQVAMELRTALQQRFCAEGTLSSIIPPRFKEILDAIIKDQDIGLLPAQDSFTSHDDIAFKLTELMYGLSLEQAPSKADFEEYPRQQTDYEALYKPFVESPLFPALYNRAKELFA